MKNKHIYIPHGSSGINCETAVASVISVFNAYIGHNSPSKFYVYRDIPNETHTDISNMPKQKKPKIVHNNVTLSNDKKKS